MPMPPKTASHFTVQAGRQIYRDDQPFISIGREGHTHPVDADEITHVIADCLNQLAIMQARSSGRSALARRRHV